MKLKRLRKNKKGLILLAIVIFQIFLLINISIAYSYIIYQTDSLIENKIISEEKHNLKNLIGYGINLLIGFLSIKQIGFVSAQEDTIDYDCCYETNEKGICQDIIAGTDPTLPKSCSSPNLNPCEKTSYCEYGWCFDPEEGLCSSGSPHEKCTQEGGEWYIDWDADKCNEGCCIASKNTQPSITQTRCENILEGHIDWSISEINCKYYSLNEGACILAGGGCKFTTEEHCIDGLGRSSNDFHEGYLCSHPDLNTGCEKQISIDCVDNKYEIYWFDSCKNRENIYSSNKNDSWNNGMVLSKEESCNFGEPNIGNEDCGNCGDDYESICAKTRAGETPVKDGDYICRDMNCDINEDGDTDDNVDRKNGEKWCVYESYVGDSRDVVGSRHWLMKCVNGEVKKPFLCDDYRGEICAEKEIALTGGGTRSKAQCRANLGFLCYTLDPDEEDYKEACEDIPDCRLQTVYVDLDDNEDCGENEICVGDACISGSDCSENGICSEGEICVWSKCIPEDSCVFDETCDEGGECETEETFKFDACVAKYPKGFDIDSTDDDKNGNTMCGLATQTCTVIYEKHVRADKDCQEEWIEEHGDVSCGDECRKHCRWWCVFNCDCREQIFVEQMNDFCISLGDCGGYVNVEGEYNKNFKVEGEYQEEIDGRWANEYTKDLDSEYEEGYEQYADSSLDEISGDVPQYLFTTPPGDYGNTISLFSDIISDEWLGDFGEDAGTWAWVFGGLGGLGGGALTILGYTALTNIWNPLGWIAIVTLLAGAGAAAFLLYFNIGDIEKFDITFTCLPWKPGVGGDDCHLCNEDPLLPCTKYQCKSLGAACGFPEDMPYEMENPPCVDLWEDDPTPPIISFLEVEEGYEESVQNNGIETGVEIKMDGECIEEFTIVNFSLETNEHAECKYHSKTTSSYEDMPENYPSDKNGHVWKTHDFIIQMPDIDDEDIDASGNYDIYVRCQDPAGNSNENEYVVRFCISPMPDLTAPTIEKTKPVSGSFLKYGNTNSSLTVYLKEIAPCKYDTVKSKKYEDMTNNFACQLSSRYPGLIYSCGAQLENLTESENTIYIKCNDTSGNINEDYPYTLHASPSKLEIDLNSISPTSGTTIKGPVNVDLMATTSGGMANGVSTCKYQIIGCSQCWDYFSEVDSSHKYTFIDMPEGDYNINITCEDEVGNEASAVTQFKVEIDLIPPIIARAYRSKDGNNLKLITNEEAKCYYSFEDCKFGFDDEHAVDMTTAFSINHSAKWITGQTYNIRCIDYWNNQDCAKKIVAGS